MKKTNKIIMVIIIIALLLLGIGYAAIQNVTLNIGGTATADPNQSNFKVMFSGTPQVSDETKVVAAITNDTNATINVSGLTKKGDTVTATYTVQNASSDLSADLSVATTNSNIEYFTLKAELAKTSLIAGEATTLTVTVTLTKTPVTGTVSSTIGIQTVATPVEPGKEGSSGSTNDSSQTPNTRPTLADVTNANIGDYIDLGNNIVGTESTSDDWKILYVEGDTVYAILAELLPNSTGYAQNAGLSAVSYANIIYEKNDVVTTQSKLTSSDLGWEGLSNGFSTTVYGTVSGDMLINSYNVKYAMDLVWPNFSSLTYNREESNLYILSSSSSYYTSNIKFESQGEGYLYGISGTGSIEYLTAGAGIRPVIALSNTIEANLVNGVWELVK